MPYISKRRLYTDQNPLEPDFSGQILEEGDSSARFILVGEGSTLSDEDAVKYGLVGYPGISRVGGEIKAEVIDDEGASEPEVVKPEVAEPQVAEAPKAEAPKAPAKAASKSTRRK